MYYKIICQLEFIKSKRHVKKEIGNWEELVYNESFSLTYIHTYFHVNSNKISTQRK